MAIKENALPVSQSIGSGDYLRKVSSGGVSQQVPFSEVKDAVVTVDSAIDSESENPVQNKAIAAALDAAGTQTQQAIATAIQTEVTDRNSAISQAISTEVSNRNQAIASAIQTETADRTAAIQEAIADEVTDRNAAIASAIDDEETARNAAISEAVEAETEALDKSITAIATAFNSIEPYIYKRNAYMNAGTIVALNGYDLYRIPANSGDIVSITWSESFYGALSGMLIFQVEHAGGTIEQLISSPPYYANFGNKNCAVMFGIEGISDVVALYVCVQNGKEDLVNFAVNRPTTQLVNEAKSVEVVTDDNFIQSQLYYRVAKDWGLFSSPYNTKIVKMYAGDKIAINKTIPAVVGTAVIVGVSGAVTQLTVPEYTATEDCIAFIYDNSTISGDIVYYPADPLLISSENVYGVLNVDRQFNGLSGVAFGTSLTYRASTSYGFLTRLAELSGITFDNQGVGSSLIMNDMLTAIKAYNDYDGKSVCLIEGFVNDWYTGQPLGTYTDATEDTVCGCVRSALNYILSQNANLTVFLILDHYGKNHGGVNCATTAVNSNNVTQYQFYEEVAKVAESLGIPVIKEYEVSQISENTPQYLADNIHLNALGAIQSGQAIWSQMKQYYPNEQ